MMESGFENVYSLKGGITDWIRHGFKVVKGEAKASENTASSAPALPTPTAPAGDSVAALKPAIITYLNGAAGSADYMMAAGAAKESLDKNRDAWLVLDIRKPDGYAKGHIPGAINVWFSDIGANFDKIRAAARGKTVIAVCEIGVGSGQVAALLNLAGVKAVDLEDGMGQNSMGRANGKGWLEAGYPAATESTAMPDTPAAADSPDPIVLHAVRDYFLKLPADFNVIKPTDFKELRDTMAANPDAYAFLDIRKPEDFARGHIAGSINYAFGPDLANHLDAVAEKAKGKTLIVVSASGQTAGQAVAVLNLIGIRAKDLALGFAGWNKFVKGELKVSEGEK
jgi:rhodanese-related sulfurtransferase